MVNKLLICLEIAGVTIIIIGQNLFHVFPFPETIPVLIIGSVSMWARGLRWKDTGLKKQHSIFRTIILALLLALAIQLLSTFVTEPLITRKFQVPPTDFSSFSNLIGNKKQLLFYLLLSWTLAAFGEELSYRAYFLNRILDLTNKSTFSLVSSVFFQGVLFGIAHYYQGVAGIVDTSITAIILGTVYFISQRNLWLLILAHGFTDTIFFSLLYFDLVKYLH